VADNNGSAGTIQSRIGQPQLARDTAQNQPGEVSSKNLSALDPKAPSTVAALLQLASIWVQQALGLSGDAKTNAENQSAFWSAAADVGLGTDFTPAVLARYGYVMHDALGRGKRRKVEIGLRA